MKDFEKASILSEVPKGQCRNKYCMIYTVVLVILVCVNFREFLILGLLAKSRIGEFLIKNIYSVVTDSHRALQCLLLMVFYSATVF